MTRPFLSVSIVTFAPEKALLHRTLRALRRACAHPELRDKPVRLTLIDNGPGDRRDALSALAASRLPETPAAILSGHGNIGFGAGHDLALMRSQSRYHLILNPDAFLAPDALAVGLRWLETHPDCALAVPHAVDGNGAYQYLCKRPPGLAVLFARGVLPKRLQAPFRPLLNRYEMRDLLGPGVTEPVEDIPLASGCCMLTPTRTAQAVGGFGDGYFLYFEDFDLSLRLRAKGVITYLPAMRIVHLGGNAAGKGQSHIRAFLRSAWTFFRRHGWRMW